MEKGPAWQRWLCAITFWVLASFFIVMMISDLNAAESGALIAVDLIAATLGCVLGVRSAASRTEADHQQLALYGLLTTRVITWEEIDQLVQATFLGRPANSLVLKDGRRVLLPFMTQVGVPRVLSSIRQRLESERPVPSSPAE